MANTYTAATNLAKPATNDTGWGGVLNANADAIDAFAAIGALAVRTTEVPSVALTVAVAAGSFRASTGLIVSYAGIGSFAISASATSCLWLTDSGTLTAGGSFPAAGTPHVRLAVVTAGASTITSITDARIPFVAAGANNNTVYLALAGGTLADGANVAVGTGTGTQVATAVGQKLGFWGVAPTSQPTSANQAAMAALTVQTLTVSTGGSVITTFPLATNTSALTDSSTGSATTTIADVGASFSQSGLNNIHASFAARWAEQRTLNTNLINAVTSLGGQINKIAVDLAAARTLLNALQSAGVAVGVWKGS